jgi:predicted nuclease with RNAse H fold
MTARNESCWAGVDVGGKRKNFHVAVVSEAAHVERPMNLGTAKAVVAWLAARRPRVVAVDSPRTAALPGELSRKPERDLVRAGICGIRFTPHEDALRSHPRRYYEWVLNGFELYEELASAAEWTGWSVIECFPTASFTRLGRPRGKSSRAAWSREVLDGVGLPGLPQGMNQDERDAVMAAVTGRAYDQGRVQTFGELVVPL